MTRATTPNVLASRLIPRFRLSAVTKSATPAHVYEVRLRKDHRGVDLTSDALPFGRLWYDTPENAIGYAMHYSRSHDAVIRVYDAAGKVIEMHEYKGDFKEP